MSVSQDSTWNQVRRELGFSDEEIHELEEATDLSVERAFDDVKDAPLEEESATTEGLEDETVLFYDSQVSLPTLTHESVHGEMLYPNQEVDLPDDDVFHQRIYGEFVAYLAEDMVGDSRPDQELLDSYDGLRHRCKVDPGVEGLDDLYSQALEADDDRTVKVIEEYQRNREQVLAAYAASEHEEPDSIRPFLDPDPEFYSEKMNYILDKEGEMLEG